MPPTTTTADQGLLALRSVLRTALADLRWVALARRTQLDGLAGWRGGHASVHRDRTRALLVRTWSAEGTVRELAALVDTAVAATRRRPLLREAPPRFTVTAPLGDAAVDADPAGLRAVVAEGRPHVAALGASAAALDERARALRGVVADDVVKTRVLAETRTAATTIRAVARRWDELDSWVVAVADALARADRAGAAALRTLGPRTGSTVGAPGHGAGTRDRTGGGAVAGDDVDDRLLAALRDPTLTPAARHRTTTLLLDRWAGDLQRSAARLRERHRTDDDLLDRVVTLVDDALLDRIDPVVHVRTDMLEEAAELERLAQGLRDLVALDDVTLLDAYRGVIGAPTVAPGTRGVATVGPQWRRGELAAPSVRLALGDPSVATHVAVLLAGTASGVGRHASALRDARALHGALRTAARPHVRVAVVVELYDAPVDLARAADRRYAAVAARELTDGLAALGLARGTRTTLVGHSYGAVAAGLTAAGLATRPPGRPLVDALVALGAPGLGVSSVDDLGIPHGEVWAARTPDDPIALVDGLARLAHAAGGGAAAAVAGHGPDPASAGFGARRLPTDGPRGRAAAGHLEYLDEGTASLDATVAVVLGDL